MGFPWPRHKSQFAFGPQSQPQSQYRAAELGWIRPGQNRPAYDTIHNLPNHQGQYPHGSDDAYLVLTLASGMVAQRLGAHALQTTAPPCTRHHLWKSKGPYFMLCGEDSPGKLSGVVFPGWSWRDTLLAALLVRSSDRVRGHGTKLRDGAGTGTCSRPALLVSLRPSKRCGPTRCCHMRHCGPGTQ